MASSNAKIPGVSGPWDVDEILARRRHHLIAAFRAQIGPYTPDFMTPGSQAGQIPDLDAELHCVATTPADTVGRQMRRLFGTAPKDQCRGDEATVTLRRFLDRGEQHFAERIAQEMSDFWQHCLGTAWPRLRARATADIEHRAIASATTGLAAGLNSLHPTITYRSAALNLDDDRHAAITTSHPLSLFPSSMAATWLLSVDPWDERGPYLIYPAEAHPDSPAHAHHPRDTPHADVIGHSRLTLLTDLHTSRTTTELAQRHYMSPSTVSYHLSRLLRAGLLTRTRSAHRVYYHRTQQADLLLNPADAPPREKRHSVLSAVLST
ncbi:helix-turn-helix domain-containing protein [Streptomyces avermitilis]|uniref:helix-turn-helix domain-containing protein n=1 Tax=Streptomyces avermitilis TaxID=33903 RepID=UPI0036CC9EC7